MSINLFNLLIESISMNRLMYECFSDMIEEMFTFLDRKEKQVEGWLVKREDKKTIQFMFEPTRYRRTLMIDPQSDYHYPLDEWLWKQKNQRQSPLVK
ncbi:UPF0236 family transposase-like protein [Alteribacillus sp. YIM 98480]|uniref:UPF0236 family transposase-like protein n=1 Tax=Alteribacillus sp. YIM 98480 TaxID=2606599 RepID=UPI00131AE140